MSNARPTPPSGCTLSTIRSATSWSRRWWGSSEKRTSSSAARGTSTSRRRRAMSAALPTGCSTYSRSNSARQRICRAASSRSHPALTSRRILPAGPRASRTASTRAASSPSPTFTFAVVQPDPVTIAWARSAEVAGTVTLTGIEDRTGRGHIPVAASVAAARQWRVSSGPYSGKGENSPQPAGPDTRIPERRVTPRKGRRRGISNALRSTTTTGPVPAGPRRQAAAGRSRGGP